MSAVIPEKDKQMVSYKSTDVFYVIHKDTALVVENNYVFLNKR